jgi:hypothetical protein
MVAYARAKALPGSCAQFGIFSAIIQEIIRPMSTASARNKSASVSTPMVSPGASAT